MHRGVQEGPYVAATVTVRVATADASRALLRTPKVMV
jgi:hypothetical protein